MADIKEMDAEWQKLTDHNQNVMKENECLKRENSRLMLECSALKDECQSLREECEQLKKKLETDTDQCLTDGSFQDDNAKVKYYTGLPNFETLMAVFSFIDSVVQSTRYTSLSSFQQFILVLMKLRINVGDQDLAYRFGVNQSTVTRYVKKWIDIMYIRLGPLVRWPNRQELIRTMPMEFRKSHKKCVLIRLGPLD